ncbi:MAG: MarR family winged helix-turn-helix transcriptional regulator [Chloroflexota bacterium]
MGKKAKDKSGDKLSKKQRKKAAAAARAAAEAAATASQALSPAEAGAVTSAMRARRKVDATELAARLANLSTVLQRQLARADAGDGLTRARLSALALLVLGGPRTLGGLAGAERVRPPTMTRLVHAMEADGLVERRPNPSDGRSTIIAATPLGERQLAGGRARQIAPLAEGTSDLDRAERVQLEDATDLLGRLLRDAAWESPEPSE